MRKLLLLALAINLGLSMNAQEALLSNRPDGLVKVWVSPKTQLQAYSLKHTIS